MGQNLILNAADHGFKVVAYNRTVAKVDRFLENEAKGRTQLLWSLARSLPSADACQASPSSAPTPSRSSSRS